VSEDFYAPIIRSELYAAKAMMLGCLEVLVVVCSWRVVKYGNNRLVAVLCRGRRGPCRCGWQWYAEEENRRTQYQLGDLVVKVGAARTPRTAAK
jgi:hypothetical protein